MKNKGKMIMIITIGIMCVILITVMFMQFKVVEETDITSIETMREAELRTEIASWKTKYEEMNKKYTETVTTINEYKEKEQNDQESTELLQKELEKANLLLGKTDVTGKGIVVTLTDNEYKDIEAYDLIQLINELRLAGAEAISVNDERIVATSDIAYINNTLIVINGKKMSSPYVVKAIGDQSYLESGLTTKDTGYIDVYIKGNKKTATIERQDEIQILKYDGEMSLKYAEEVKE